MHPWGDASWQTAPGMDFYVVLQIAFWVAVVVVVVLVVQRLRSRGR